jgi:hypothetical protein
LSALALDPVLPENRLLSVLLLTLNFLAASEILGAAQECKEAIASSIAAMLAELSRDEVLLMGLVKVCTVRGCASHRETFYNA